MVCAHEFLRITIGDRMPGSEEGKSQQPTAGKEGRGDATESLEDSLDYQDEYYGADDFDLP